MLGNYASICSGVFTASEAAEEGVLLNVLSPQVSGHWLQGSGVHSSSVMQGMVFKRPVEGVVTKAEDSKIVVYTCPLDILQTETKVWATGSLASVVANRRHCSTQ